MTNYENIYFEENVDEINDENIDEYIDIIYELYQRNMINVIGKLS